MNINYNYIRGTKDGTESVEFEIRTSSGNYITTCVVHVNRLLNGLKTHPCGDGEDFTLDEKTKKMVLKTLHEGRSGIKYSGLIKTLESWNGSGLNLYDYLAVGDKVDEALVDEQRDCVPPNRMGRGYLQVGEPFRHKPDDSGVYRPTYATFINKNGSDSWVFAGYCFSDEEINRVEDKGIVLNAV